MSVADQLRDVRRGAEPGMLELTLTSGEVYIVTCYGLHEQEQQRVQAALLVS